MEWVAKQEGIDADAETLAVLAQVTQALTEQDSRRMLDVVMELERNGRNLQHFCRELARYFRNLLVAKVAGANTRLIGASQHEQERLAQIAGGFSEEDLTRYLQITLDLFQDLQASLQPRLHLEVGLLRLVQAGKLLPIEEAIAGLGGSGPLPKPAPPAPPKPAPPTMAVSLTGPWKDRLHSALTEAGMQFTADAVEHSQITESNGELLFAAPEEFHLALNGKDILKVVQKVAGRPMRVKVTTGAAVVTEIPKARPPQDDVSERALSHPEVRRFQETFPDAQVRVVRNLKE
jgi:DNA polymerase-3 subunit gamma/tau